MRRLILFLLACASICWGQNVCQSGSLCYVSATGNDLNDGSSWTRAFLTVGKALASMSANGGRISIGCGTFSYATALNITKPSTTIAGSGGRYGTGCTVLNPAAGVSGINVNAAPYAVIQDLRIVSSSTSAGSDIGIHVYGNTSDAPTIQNVSVENFGSHGIDLDSASSGGGIVDDWRLINVMAYANRGDGFHFEGGGDTSLGISENCWSTNNHGWGYSLATGGNNDNVFVAPLASGNLLGGYNLAGGQSNRFIAPYCEAGVGSSFIIASAATTVYNSIDFANFGQCQTITEGTPGANRILYTDRTPELVQNGVTIAPDPGATGAVSYALKSGWGGYGNGILSLSDDTNHLTLLTCFLGICTWGHTPVVPPSTPASSGASCTVGQIWSDANYVYVCTSGAIKRIALSTF